MNAGRIRPESWIAPDEPPPFELANDSGPSRAILVCDHASARIPRRLGTLGVAERDLRRHVAWDIGAALVARGLSQRLDAPLVLAGYSRLVIDCNRPPGAADSIVKLSEDVEIPGNVSVDTSEAAARTEAFFWPYHDTVHRIAEARMLGEAVPVLVSVHSFTPVYHGESRPWHIGVNQRHDRRLAALLLDGLKADESLYVGENEPYPVDQKDYTILVHAERRGLPYVLLEIRQDLIDTESSAYAWAEQLATLLDTALTAASLDKLVEPAPDVREPRFETMT